MTNDEAKGVLFDMLGKGIYVKNTKENQAILAALRALEQKPCEDWYDVSSDEMTLRQARQAVRDLRKMWAEHLPSVSTRKAGWIPISERLPETDNENNINNYNVLLWVKNKSHPEREPQIYLGKLRHIDGDDGNGNFWGIETKPCDWTIWGWCYFNEPEVIAWMPLPEPYRAESEVKE